MKKDRFGIVIFFFILFFILLEIRIIIITLFPDPRLKNDKVAIINRGTIYDINHKELAVTSATYSIYIRPNQIPQNLKESLKNYFIQNNILSSGELQIFDTGKSFVWLKRKLSSGDSKVYQNLIDYLKKNKYMIKDDIGILPEQGRYYPNISAAAIIGIVGTDNQGLSGLEHSMDKYLEKGFSVYTSLDADLSTIAYDELKNAILVNQAESGSAAILSLEDKSILALVNYPSFDPNNIKNITTENLKSLATSFIYEPGSVMKQFSAAFALDKGIAAPGSPVFYCSGAVTIADHDFTCDAAHGRVDLSTIIQKSCNVGMVQLADSFKKIEFYSFLSKFGFGRPVSIPLSDSETGILRPFEKWSGLSKYMISIGQEIGVTTAQLLTAASIIGNEGVYHAPQLVIKIENSQKSNVYIPDNTTYQVITKDTSEKLLKMMTTVVSENGTALSAKIEGISIAGKTGTGQIARKDGTGYYSDLFNSVFMGYIPSENPRFVVVIAIHKPKGDKHTGGLVAAPTFAGIVRRMIVSTSYFSK